MREQPAIADMIAALKTALADCVPGSQCRRLLEECLRIVESLGTSETSEPAVRVARARKAAQMLRQASLKKDCQNQPSMESARRVMTSMLFAVTQPP
jgi:hypothetical protein